MKLSLFGTGVKERWWLSEVMGCMYCYHQPQGEGQYADFQGGHITSRANYIPIFWNYVVVPFLGVCGRGEGGFAFCWGVELFFKFQVSAHFPWQFCNIITPSPVLSNDQSLSGKLIRVWLWFTELWNIWWWHSGPDQLLMFNDIWHIIWLRERRHVTLTSTWTLFILKCMFHIY